MNLIADPIFVKAEMDYRRERALGLVGRRSGAGLWARSARLRRRAHPVSATPQPDADRHQDVADPGGSRIPRAGEWVSGAEELRRAC